MNKFHIMVIPRKWFIAGILAGISLSVLGINPAWGVIRIDPRADLQATPEEVGAIEYTFIKSDSAIAEGDLIALMENYSERCRYKELTKADMRAIWQDFFEHFSRVDPLHAFTRIVVIQGNPLTAEITSTGVLWATSNQTYERVNLVSWVGDIHHMIFEDGMWKFLGQGRNAADRTEFGQVPPPLY